MPGEFMTPDRVIERRTAMEKQCSQAKDSEDLHRLEDDLYYDVLWHIAEGKCIEPALCAKEALLTKEMKFYRWCA